MSATSASVLTSSPQRRRSPGAPVPVDPMNNFFPSGSVRSPPLALFDPSLARNPWTTIAVPAATDVLFQPRRSSAFGAPPSIIQLTILPSGPLTSM